MDRRVGPVSPPSRLRRGGAGVLAQALRFAVVGLGNTVASYGVYAAMLWLGLGYVLAGLVSIVCGIAISFTTQGTLVFGGATRAAFVRFVLVWAALYSIYIGVVAVAERSFGLNSYVGGLVALVVTTALSFVLQRSFVFRASRTDAGPTRE